ncbi:MAG: PD-(D/E)XK nuclease family protein [Candidatus Kerfeldbacteria bacterium]|nr:PD-(D/E)XK nuclease family protein [Candidatus Kerfeldbacteria bacterium]
MAKKAGQGSLFEKPRTKTTARSRPARSHPSKILPPIRLSPSTGLNLYSECPRCFYLHHAKRVQRPRGIFPSLPGGMDLVIKDYFDHYRGSLPPELDGKVPGALLDDAQLLARWRNWRTGPEYHDAQRNATLFGALDDCLVVGGAYVPLDYKTKGSAPHDGDGERYYQLQLDSYSLLLQESGYPVADFSYLVYYFPKQVNAGGMVTFTVQPMRVATDPKRARKTFERAVDLLRGKDVPTHHVSCAFCSWNQQLQEFD